MGNRQSVVATLRTTFARSIAVAVFAVSFLVVSPAGAAPASIDSEQIDKSIVWVDTTWTAVVEVPFQDGSVERFKATTLSLCTGWFVSETGHIATAGHCVEASSDVRVALYANVISKNGLTGVKAQEVEWPMAVDAPLVEVGQPSGVEGGVLSGQETVIAQLIEMQGFDNGDNALLRVADMRDTPALQVSTITPKVGEKVTTIGFAGLVANNSDVQRQRPSYRSGDVSSRSYSTRGVPRTEIDADVIKGMSGGPAVNQDGEVIGINSSLAAGGSSQVNFITDTQTLRDFLEANGVRLQASTPPSSAASQVPAAGTVKVSTDSASTPSMWLVAVIIVLAVLLVTMAAWTFFIRKKPAAPAPASSVDSQAPPAV